MHIMSSEQLVATSVENLLCFVQYFVVSVIDDHNGLVKKSCKYIGLRENRVAKGWLSKFVQ